MTDMPNTFGRQSHQSALGIVLRIQQAAVTFPDAINLPAQLCCRKCCGLDHCIQARCVAPASVDRDLPDHPCVSLSRPNLSAARALAFAASSSLFFGGALVSNDWRRRIEMAAISSTAARNAASFACDGLVKPLIFRTN